MSTTVLLVNPPIYDFAAYDFFNKPLGLLYLAGWLRRAGYDVRLIDALDRRFPLLTERFGPPKVRSDGTGKYHRQAIQAPACLAHVPRHYARYGLPADLLTEALTHECKHHRPVAVLVTSMMTYWYPAVADTIRLIRRTIPGVPVALGGVYAQLMGEHARNTCRPERLFPDGAVRPILQWLDQLAGRGGNYDAFDENFSTWPAPMYELYHKLDYLTLMSSLGCPFRCHYCASHLLQNCLQQCSADAFVDQLLNLLGLLGDGGSDLNIALMDDALLAQAPDHIIPILRSLAKLNLPLRFHCPNGLHARFIGPEVAELMHANRFGMIRLSYEAASLDNPARRASDNKVNDRDLIRAVVNLENAGYKRSRLEAYILIGLPDQPLQQMLDSALAVNELGLRICICQYSPIPGTSLFTQACRQLGIDPNEPLLHNNSLLRPHEEQDAGSTAGAYAVRQQFKDVVMQMNRSLE